MDLSRPPVKAGGGANQRRLVLQVGTARELDVFQVLDAGEMLIDQDRISQGPQVLGRLQFRRIGGQKQEMHMLGKPQAEAAMPPSSIQHQHDLLPRTCSDGTSKRGKFGFNEGNRDTGGQMKDGTAGSRMDEAHHIAPSEAMLHEGSGPPANVSPDPAQERLEADAMLVHRPWFDPTVGQCGCHLLRASGASAV